LENFAFRMMPVAYALSREDPLALGRIDGAS